MARVKFTSWFSVRRGFVLGLIAGLGVVGTSLYALTFLPRFAKLTAPLEQEGLWLFPRPTLRAGVPVELTWFFLKFPYLSGNAQIFPLNHHRFRVCDPARDREYVVHFGQTFRRVEIYLKSDPRHVRIRVYTPGSLREVCLEGPRIVSDAARPDGNLWMWSRPLWNAQHLKIYGLTDLWLNAPYKKYSCAGFVHQFLSDAGIRVPVLDAWDMAKLPWTRVRADELEPGDIITIRAATRAHRRFWGHRITHVGVYIGNGKIIHASTASPHARRSFVRVADLDVFRTRIDKILRPPDLQ